MNNELTHVAKLNVKKGLVEFSGYETLKAQAHQVAETIRTSEVTDATVSANKKMLAVANKTVNELENYRKSVKQQLLEPYNDFEAKVKEIVSIVKDAERESRGKILELEQMERDAKEEEIRMIFEARMRPYKEDLTFIKFEDFLKPQHLNKSVSMNKVEEAMVEWLNQIHGDYAAILELPNSDDVLTEYVTCLDLRSAIYTVAERDRIKETFIEPKTKPTVQKKTKTVVFKLSDEKDAKLAEMLLKENNIAYEKEII